MAGARPIKFTKQRRGAALDALRRGFTRTAAAAAAGVHYSTMFRHMEDDDDFCNAVEQAEAEAVAMAIRVAYPVDEDGHFETKADAKEWLAKRQRVEWGNHQQVDVNQSGETVVRFEYSDGEHGDS